MTVVLEDIGADVIRTGMLHSGSHENNLQYPPANSRIAQSCGRPSDGCKGGHSLLKPAR